MIRSVIAVFCLIAASLAASDPAAAFDLKPERVDGNPLWPVHYLTPSGGRKIDGLVIVISDRQGWDAAAEALARHLADDGEAVMGLELPVYEAAMSHDTYECSAVNRDMEVLSRDIEKDLPFQEYRPPVVIGIGAGSAIAYAAIGEVLPNTLAGGIGLRFDPSIDLGHRLCLPMASTAPGEKPRYAPVTDHETPFLFTPSAGFAAPGGGLDAFVAQMPQAHVIAGAADDLAAVDTGLRQIPRVGKAEASVDGLPIVELPPAAGAHGAGGPPGGALPMIIFYSGDGGWRDIDKKIGGYLSDEGYFVVGIDALRYFWRKKEPREMAADLDRLIRHYRGKARDNGVILVGYSFGADLLPFMVNRMSADTRAEIRLISLLGISDRASFEIRLEGILGARNTDGPPTLPELERLPKIPVQCVFGFDEHDSVCTAKELDGIVQRVEMQGGHHFDGDYRHIADLIVAADKARDNVSKSEVK